MTRAISSQVLHLRDDLLAVSMGKSLEGPSLEGHEEKIACKYLWECKGAHGMAAHQRTICPKDMQGGSTTTKCMFYDCNYDYTQS
jgi:hypothetical protein